MEKEYNYKDKTIDEIRSDFMCKEYDDVVITPEMFQDILFKVNLEKAQNNQKEFLDSVSKLMSLKSAHEKLPYEIDKMKILKYLKHRLASEKAYEISAMKCRLFDTDPIETLRTIEVYELLLDYLENDKTISIDNPEKDKKGATARQLKLRKPNNKQK